MIGNHATNSYEWLDANAVPAHQYLLPAIRSLLPADGKGCRVLDMGCGNGRVASHLAAEGFDVTGFDLSPDGIDIARRAHPTLTFEVGSVYDDMSTSVGRDFDWVITSEVIEHLYYPKRLLENAFAAIRPGGGIVVTTPYHGYLKNLALSLANKWDDHHAAHSDGGHIKFLSPRTLTRMLADVGFSEPFFANAGRVPFLWKSMVCRATKP
jgi:2-polyprenyl-3-methyl-5-hydroxy-6-metoxy-1,4-benzoquinol methylase